MKGRPRLIPTLRRKGTVETVKVILNPYAGRGRGERVAGEIEAAFRRGNVPFEMANPQRLGKPSLWLAARGWTVTRSWLPLAATGQSMKS